MYLGCLFSFSCATVAAAILDSRLENGNGTIAGRREKQEGVELFHINRRPMSAGHPMANSSEWVDSVCESSFMKDKSSSTPSPKRWGGEHLPESLNCALVK